MQRFDMYLVDLRNQIGSEQQGLRPALVVQNNAGNAYSPTTIICPITSSKTKNNIPTHVILKPDECDIKKESVVLCEQIRAVDKQRLLRFLGQIQNQKIINEINKKLMISLGVSNE